MISIYGVIGDPIKHSLSARMQNRAFQEAGLDAVYLPFHVRPDELRSFITAANRWPCRGLNVTLPHKQTVMEFLDEISDEAKAIGAANTISFRDDKLIGDNTDARGYIRSLKEEKDWSPQDKTVTLLGAGGAARAVLSRF